ERMGKKLEGIEFKIGLEHKTQASLLIGDKALQNPSRGTEYDLGKEWNDWHQTPFTYAAWMTFDPAQSELCQDLQHSRDLGLKNIQKIISEIKNYPEKLLTEYFTKALDYYMDETSLKGIQQFYKYYQSIEGDTHELDFKFVRES
ncbi:MAG: hypothetical protein JNK65_03230, partial [Deltaproteobacteria bacterium]|nr:hypothetical protein [Deltaproteobacteria bacterium]